MADFEQYKEEMKEKYQKILEDKLDEHLSAIAKNENTARPPTILPKPIKLHQDERVKAVVEILSITEE